MEKNISRSEALKKNVLLERLCRRPPASSQSLCPCPSFLANVGWSRSCSAQPPLLHTPDDTPSSSAASTTRKVASPPNLTTKHLFSLSRVAPNLPPAAKGNRSKLSPAEQEPRGNSRLARSLLVVGSCWGPRSLIESSFFSYSFSPTLKRRMEALFPLTRSGETCLVLPDLRIYYGV